MPFYERTQGVNIAFVVSSTIDTNQGQGQNFPYSLNRSCFVPEERLQQTRGTLNALNLISADSPIYVLETSKHAEQYGKELSYVPGLRFVNINSIDPAVGEIGRNHPSKGFCEASASVLFLNQYYEELKQYDYIVKITGRYFFSSFNKNIFNAENKDKYIVGKIRQFSWNADWNYPNFLNKNNKLFWMPTWAYGLGTDCLDQFKSGYQKIINFYQENPILAPYMDLECLFYEYIVNNNKCVDAPWIINGWNGVSGKFFTE